MSPRTLVFDLETQRLAQEVGGWSFVDRLGLAGAVALDTESGTYHRFAEKDAPDLIRLLNAAEVVVGYNVIRFDYPVLKPYGFDPSHMNPEAKTVDLLDHLYRILGFHVALDNVVGATLGEQKSANGLAAVEWFRQGLIEKVLDYCQEDVRLTWRLWEHGRQQRAVRFRDRDYRLREVRVAW